MEAINIVVLLEMILGRLVTEGHHKAWKSLSQAHGSKKRVVSERVCPKAVVVGWGKDGVGQAESLKATLLRNLWA